MKRQYGLLFGWLQATANIYSLKSKTKLVSFVAVLHWKITTCILKSLCTGAVVPWHKSAVFVIQKHSLTFIVAMAVVYLSLSKLQRSFSNGIRVQYKIFYTIKHAVAV